MAHRPKRDTQRQDRQTRIVREILLRVCGRMERREVARVFGLNTSTIARIMSVEAYGVSLLTLEGIVRKVREALELTETKGVA